MKNKHSHCFTSIKLVTKQDKYIHKSTLQAIKFYPVKNTYNSLLKRVKGNVSFKKNVFDGIKFFNESNLVNKMKLYFFLAAILFFTFGSLNSHAQEWYVKPENTQSRWISFENPEGKKGAGGRENKGAKGHAFDQIKAGETVALLEVDGAGIINRIWLTINDRSPKMLRSLRLDMYWDGEQKPAVSAPLGDFFGVGLGKRLPFETELFSDPEGRSFNCSIPMPYRNGARITLTNESETDLTALFYDINFLKKDKLKNDVMYFHAWWNRDLQTELTKDYEILPQLTGSGRFLGMNMGILTDEVYDESWWGEGEVKMYVDGDGEFPTIIGTGTEDYIGTAWGQGVFNHRYQGCLIADTENGEFAFYRYHINDPVYFSEDIRIAIQQIGGWQKDRVLELVGNGAELMPISVHAESGDFIKLLEQDPVPKLPDADFPNGWVNFYRRDDVSSTAYFYLDRPANNLPELAPVDVRTAKMESDQN